MQNLFSATSASTEQKYRHEYKYVCDEMQIAIIQARLRPILNLDTHTLKQGSYTIRSLYFDDPHNSCYFENEHGTDPREKYRIRIYNSNTARISLELKRKERGKTLKTSCMITEEQCKILMRGDLLPDDPSYPPVLQKLLLQIKTRNFQPKIIVEYLRIPYVYPIGNVRITLDKDISSSTCISSFLDPDIPKRPIMPLGKHVLEVKYDELLPDYIHTLLQIPQLQHTAFSKYYLCRKFSHQIERC